MFGRTVVNLNILPQYLLSGGKRYLTDSSANSKEGAAKKTIDDHQVVLWPQKFIFGVYKATVILKPSEGAQPFVQSIVFIALPVYLLLALSFFVFLFISIYLRVKKKI
jgi:hypothetical protein